MKQWLTQEQVEKATRLWREGAPLDALCAACGFTRDVLISRRRDQLAHLAKRPRGVNSQLNRSGDPTPAEIAERAATIRAGWSEVERLNRISAPGAAVGTWTGERHGGRRVSSRMPRRNW